MFFRINYVITLPGLRLCKYVAVVLRRRILYEDIELLQLHQLCTFHTTNQFPDVEVLSA